MNPASHPNNPIDAIVAFAVALPLPEPPGWLVEDAHQRLVLLLNHVLQQEPEAMRRLKPHGGSVVLFQWRMFSFKIKVTPVGLLNLAEADDVHQLRLEVEESSLGQLARQLFNHEKPNVRIEGDARLAAELNWMAEFVRWDIEEDLSKVVGDVIAVRLTQIARSAAQAVKAFAHLRFSKDNA